MSSSSEKKRPIYISPASEFSAIKMKRLDFDGSFLLVEGPTDSELLGKLLNCKRCNIRPVEGKENAIEIIKIAERFLEPGILSIIDADFDHVLGYEYENANIIRTETYDIEGLMLKSKALDHLLNEKSDRQKLRKFLQEKDIRTFLLSKAESIGYLRSLSIKNNWKIKFNGMLYSRFIDSKTLDIIFCELVSTVRDITHKGEFYKEDIFEITEILENYKSPTEDLWLLCNGHDLMNILSIGLRYNFGKEGENIKFDELERKLRKHYKLSYFKTTQLYHRLKEWEENNTPYTVLRYAS